MNKKLIALGALAFFTLIAATSAFALWEKPSGIKKESYDKLVSKNLELKTKIDSLVRDYENFKERYNLLMEKVKSLQYEKERLVRENRISKFTASGGKNEIENLKKELLETRLELSGLEAAAAKKPVEPVIKGAEKKYKKRVAQLEKELRAVNSEAEIREKELKKYADDLKIRLTEEAKIEKKSLEKKFKADLNAQDEIRKARDKKIRKLSDEIQELRSGAKERAPEEKELRALRDRVKALRAENDEIKKHYHGKENDLTSLNVVVRKLKADLDARKEVLNKQSEKTRSLERQLASARSDFRGRDKELKKQYALRDTQDDKIKSLEKELKERDEYLEEALNEAKGERGIRDEKIEKLEKSLKGQYSVNAAKDDKIKSLAKKLEAAIESQSAARKNLKQSIDVLGASYQELEIQNKELKKKLKGMEEKNRAANNALANMKKTKEKENKMTDEKINKFKKEFESAVKDRSAAEIKQKEAEAALKEESAARKKLAKKIKSLEKKINAEEKKLQLKQTKVELENKKIELKIKKIEEKSKSVRLAAELREAKKEIANTRSVLEKEMTELRKENRRLAAGEKYATRAKIAAERKEKDLRGRVDKITEKLNKERLDMHYNLAVVFDENKKYEDAEREYMKCLELKSDDAGVYYNLGILYDDKLQKKHKAAEYYKKFLELRPLGIESMHVRDWLFKLEQEHRLGLETR